MSHGLSILCISHVSFSSQIQDRSWICSIFNTACACCSPRALLTPARTRAFDGPPSERSRADYAPRLAARSRGNERWEIDSSFCGLKDGVDIPLCSDWPLEAFIGGDGSVGLEKAAADRDARTNGNQGDLFPGCFTILSPQMFRPRGDAATFGGRRKLIIQ